MRAKRDDAPPAQLSANACRRVPVLLLAFTAAGACAGLGLHMHAGADNGSVIEEELTRLRARNHVLEERAKLASSEQQDLARIVLDPRAKQRLLDMVDRSQAFEAAAARGNALQSGVANTSAVRDCLGRWLFELNISSMLDVPCGDGNWQHLIPGVENITYVGAGINIDALEIAKHRRENIEKGMNFMLFDTVSFPLKRKFDMILYRHAAERQPIGDTLRALLNFKQSGSRYLAASYWPHSSPGAYQDLERAGWFQANLMQKPFGLGQPIVSCANNDQGSPYQSQARLGIWRLKDVVVTQDMVRLMQQKPGRSGDGVPAAAGRDTPPRMRGAAGAAGAARARNEYGMPLPRAGGGQEDNDADSGTFRNRRPQRNKAQDLNEIMKLFSNAFAPRRQRIQAPRVIEERHGDANPFDGLFSDFLETPGTVRRGLPSRRPMLPTQIFELPGFHPLHHESFGGDGFLPLHHESFGGDGWP